MPEVPHDETVGLRLELGRIRDQRDAFAAALRKEVRDALKDILRDELRRQLGGQDDSEVARLNERINNLVIKNNDREAEYMQLYSENASLRYEIERLRKAKGGAS
jgi:hypothetical protein